jgi:hypothetical protein
MSCIFLEAISPTCYEQLFHEISCAKNNNSKQNKLRKILPYKKASPKQLVKLIPPLLQTYYYCLPNVPLDVVMVVTSFQYLCQTLPVMMISLIR